MPLIGTIEVRLNREQNQIMQINDSAFVFELLYYVYVDVDYEWPLFMSLFNRW